MSDGRENYSRYYYLWHLVGIGALKLQPMDGDGDGDGDG